MALFTDGPVAGMEDLTAQDTQLSNVANVEGIDVTQKLILAQEELALELEMLLESGRRAEQVIWLAPQPGIGNVVVTPALKLWHTFRTLEMVYRDAYSNQLNDRYGAKRDQFQERAKWAYEKVLLLGLGMAWSPIPKAMEPQVVSAPGNLADGTYYVTVAWTNTVGEEGGPSGPTALTTTGSTLLVQPTGPPACAAGWNVYVGTDPGALSLQNGSPITVAQTWLQPDTIATGGRAAGTGQSPSYVMPAPRRILRG
jgi:hypothetical protein